MADEFEVRLTADDEITPAAKKAADALDDIPAKVDVKIKADTDSPKRDIDQLISKLDKLGSGDAANLLLSTNAKQITNEIGDLVLKLDKLDADDPNVDITISNIASLTSDLDELQTKAKALNDVPIDIGAKTSARGGFDKIIDGADQAKSSVANMVGNSAQDLGQLAGVTGSAGVAVGQLAEYFTDSAFAAKSAGQGFGAIFKSFAQAVGPIAAITVVVGTLTELLGRQSAEADAAAARTKTFGDAMRGASDDAVGLADSLRENSDALRKFDADAQGFGGGIVEGLSEVASAVPLLGGAFGDAGQNVTDLLKILNTAGLSVFDFAEEIQNGGRVGSDFERTLRAQADAGKITADQYTAMLDALREYGQSALDASAAQKAFNVDAGEANSILQDLTKQTAPLEQFGDAWATLLGDMQDGTINTKEAADAVNFLAEKLGLTQAEVIKLGQGQLDENMKSAAKATEEAAQAAEEAAAQFLKLSVASGALRDLTEQAAVWERRSDAFATAFDFGNNFRDAAGQVRDIAAAIDGLSEAADGISGEEILSGGIGADAILDELDALRPEIQSRITDAFATVGPEAGVEMANGYIDSVTAELGGKLSREDVARLLNLSDLDATVKVGVEADSIATARAQLEILTGLNGETPYTASIKLALDAGTITGEQAQTLIQASLQGAGVEIPAALAVPTTGDALTQAGDALRANPLEMPTTLDTTGLPAAAADAAAVVEGTSADIAVGADTGQAETDIAGAKKTADSTKGELTVSAQTRDAVNTILYVALVASLLKPVINVTANASSAESTITNAARARSTTLNVETAGVAAAQSALNSLTQPKSVTIRPVVSPTSVLVRVDGG